MELSEIFTTYIFPIICTLLVIGIGILIMLIFHTICTGMLSRDPKYLEKLTDRLKENLLKEYGEKTNNGCFWDIERLGRGSMQHILRIYNNGEKIGVFIVNIDENNTKETWQEINDFANWSLDNPKKLINEPQFN